MKALVLHFEDSEFAELKAAKGKTPWREFILSSIVKKEAGKENPGPSPSPSAASRSPQETCP